MNYTLDEGAAGGARFGLILLSNDETLEHETRAVIARRDVNMLHARIPSIAEVTPETLVTMADEMTATASLLPPDLRVVGYACTSGATVIGPGEVSRLVQVAHPETPVTNPMCAVIAALRAVGAAKIGLVSPYVPSVTGPMCAHLADHGINVLHQVSFGQSDDQKVARISENSTRAAMLEAGRAEGVEAVFASCTNLRTFGIIEEVEETLGKPVISSNQALIWHMLRLAGLDAKGWGPGRLYQG